jgi:prolipoprotein diacylglyceryltransferase
MSELISYLLSAHPIFWQLGGITIYAHAVFFVIGAEVAYLALGSLAARRNLPDESLGYWSAAVFIAGLVGARIGYFALYPSQFQSIGQALSIWQGGLVSYWGMAAGLAVGWLLVRRQSSRERLIWFDLLCIVAMLGWALGRLGNYYAADSVGVTSQAWNMFYGRVPIQLFESVLCAGLGLAGWKLQKRWAPGGLGLVLMAGYLGGRFFIDFWRDEGMVGPFHVSQVVSLILIPLLIPLILHYARPESR